jgi:hypothetical protein
MRTAAERNGRVDCPLRGGDPYSRLRDWLNAGSVVPAAPRRHRVTARDPDCQWLFGQPSATAARYGHRQLSAAGKRGQTIRPAGIMASRFDAALVGVLRTGGATNASTATHRPTGVRPMTWSNTQLRQSTAPSDRDPPVVSGGLRVEMADALSGKGESGCRDLIPVLTEGHLLGEQSTAWKRSAKPGGRRVRIRRPDGSLTGLAGLAAIEEFTPRLGILGQRATRSRSNSASMQWPATNRPRLNHNVRVPLMTEDTG